MPALFALLACGDDEPLPAPPPSPCTGSATVLVGPGTAPIISWTPRCAVHRIQVFQQVGGQRETWHVRSGTGILPGVRYGSAIDGATNVTGPVALVAGRATNLVLLMEVGGSLTPIGGASFTP